MPRRVIVVALLSLLSIALWAPDVGRAFGHPIGIFSRQAVVAMHPLAAVTPTTVQQYADLEPTPPLMRLRWMRNGMCWMSSPGQICSIHLLVNGRRYAFDSPAVAEDPSNGTFVLVRVGLALVWLGCGAALVLLRPSKATWAFFALSLYGWSPNNIVTETGPAWVQIAVSAFVNAWEVTIPWAACLFALYLMQPAVLPAWRARSITVLYVIGAASAAFAIGATFAIVYGANEAVYHLWERYYNGLPIAGILTPFILLATYLESERTVRQRIRWVLVGFTLGACCLVATSYLAFRGYAPYSVAQAAYVFCVTASTMYAVLRHHIIDVNVVLSRTLVYTLLSAFVVGLFALVDMFFSRALSASNAGLMADVALALVLGFFMNTMHHRVDRFVDGILFRSRHLAEQHVILVAQSLRHAEDERAVNRMLLDEPVRALDLSFGTLARRVDADTLQVDYSTTNGPPPGATISNAESLCAYLVTERKPLILRHHYWDASQLRCNDVEPTVAVPVFSHEDLSAIVFLAPHRNGTELDGDELALVERVADAAGAAYDRLEVKILRERLALSPLVPKDAHA